LMVLPKIRSPIRRWPCVVIAIKSHRSRSAVLRISDGGSPSARWAETSRPSARNFVAVASRYPRSSFISCDSASLSCSKLRATQPSATCTRSKREPSRLARSVTCGSRLLSARLFSSATRILRYMAVLKNGRSLQPLQGFVEQVFHVQQNNNSGREPGQNFHPQWTDELAHFSAVAGEHDQGYHGKGKLHAQNDLAEDQQLGRAGFAVEGGAQDRRHDGNQPRDEPAQPGTEADVEKAFHDNLSGQRSGESGILSRGQQRDREQRARHRHAQHWTEQFVSVLNLRDVVVAACVKGGRRNDENS